MIKKVGLSLIGILFLGLYILVSDAIFSGSDNITYVKEEMMFGSMTLLGVFITMTIVLLIVCNYIIDNIFKKKKK